MAASGAEPTLVLTIDAGGSGVKASVLCVREWRVLGSGRREYHVSYPAPHLAEFDTGAWWAAMLEAGAEAVARAQEPAGRYLAVTCTAMRIPFVLLDRDGEPLAPGVLNLDGRGQEFVCAVREALGGDALYALTGHWPAVPLGLPKLLWFMQRRPELWARVRHVLQMHDWMLYELCGVMTSEPSSASMSQALDVARRCWATELLATLGLAPELFPPLRDAGSYLGGLKPAVARALGLRGGTPVHVGGGDTHVGCLGADGVEDGRVVIVAGSTTPLQLTAASPLCDATHRPWVSAHLWPGLWAVEMNVGATGLMYKWLRDLLSSNAAHDYARLDGLAAQAPLGAHDLLVTTPSPTWGEAAWNRMPPGTLFGLSPVHDLSDLARAILESVCYAVRGNLGQLESVNGRPFAQITLTGGASQSPLWSQMLADVLGKPLRVPLVAEASAVAGGRLVLKDQRTAWGEPLPERHYLPDSARHAAYQPYHTRYLAVHQELGLSFGGGRI